MKEYKHLTRSTPEAEGISSYQLVELLDGMELNNIELHNIMVAVNGKIIFEGCNYPYREDIPHIIHSMTKAFTNTAVAKAYSEGLLKLSDKVVSFFEDEAEQYLPDNPSQNLLDMTVEDLITMRCGHNREISGSEWRPLKTSWIKAFFEEQVVHKPGDYYCYSSACSYMLSAIVQKVSGKTAHDYLREGFLDKLGIREFTWDVSPEGICSGGNGISICIEDIVKLGIIYQQDGVWEGEQLIEKEWVDRAFGRINALEPQGINILQGLKIPYNYHWFQFDDLYTASGIFGQNCMVIPKLNMVVGVTAAVRNWERVPEVVNEYLVKPHISGTQTKINVAETLANKGKRMNLLYNVKSVDNSPRFTFQETVYYVDNHPDKITEISFREIDQDILIFTMKDHRGSHTVHCCLDKWNKSASSITGNYLHHQYQPDQSIIFAAAWWNTPTCLRMEWRYPEMTFCDYLSFDFSYDMSEVEMNRWVNVNTQDLKREPLIVKKKYQ